METESLRRILVGENGGSPLTECGTCEPNLSRNNDDDATQMCCVHPQPSNAKVFLQLFEVFEGSQIGFLGSLVSAGSRSARSAHANRGRDTLRRIPASNNCVFYGPCFMCGQEGHSQNYCPLRKCEFCNMYGHGRRVCFLSTGSPLSGSGHSPSSSSSSSGSSSASSSAKRKRWRNKRGLPPRTPFAG